MGRGDKPDEEPFGPALNQESAGEDNPIHQPWCQLGRIRSLQGFIRSKEREEEGCDGAVECSIVCC